MLSGMNTLEMIEDNINTASTTEIGSLGPAEEEMLQHVVKAIRSRMKVGCTGCGKCETHCPQHIEIRAELKNAVKELEGPAYKVVRKFVELYKAF